MCGLVAVISKKEFGFNFSDRDIFDQLLYADALRGVDSTGVFSVNKYGNVSMRKSAQNSATFRDTKTYQDWLSEAYQSGRIMVGHNRAATKGAKVDQNAHPFIADHICLVHNGTLHSHKHLADVDVDSHAIAISMAKSGYEKTLQDIFGAYALIWYNAKEKKLHIARNNQRPLHMVDTKDAIYIASEDKMLEWVLDRNNVTHQPVCYFSDTLIYTWEIGKQQTKFFAEKFEKKAMVKGITPGIVIPWPTDTTVPGQDTTTKKTGKVLGFYNYGDVVSFSNDTNSVYDARIKFYGTTCDGHVTAVQGIQNISKLSLADQEMLCSGTDFLRGTVVGCSTSLKSPCLIVENLVPDIQYLTCDGQAIDYTDINFEETVCQDCGNYIDLDEEDGRFWARIKRGVIKAYKCSKCVKKHKHLKGNHED